MSTNESQPYSLRWMWALRQAELPSSLKLLGYAMMAHADKDGLTRPSVAQLVLAIPKTFSVEETASIGEATIKRARAKLVRLGWLELVERGRRSGRGKGLSSTYRLTFPTPLPDQFTGSEGESLYRISADPPSDTCSDREPSTSSNSSELGTFSRTSVALGGSPSVIHVERQGKRDTGSSSLPDSSFTSSFPTTSNLPTTPDRGLMNIRAEYQESYEEEHGKPCPYDLSRWSYEQLRDLIMSPPERDPLVGVVI